MLKDLSDEQRSQMRELRDRLLSQDADPATCRAEREKLLRSFGIDPPVRGGRGPCGKGRGPGFCRTGAQGPGDGESKPRESSLNNGPAQGMLRGNHPNPFNPETVIRFELPQAGPVLVQVLDLEGRLVRTLVRDTRGAGAQQVVWNGKDDKGVPVASGTYFYRLEAGSFVETDRMILIR